MSFIPPILLPNSEKAIKRISFLQKNFYLYRISVERKRFNDTARAYNTAIRTFPRNLLAGMFGFDKRPYFESEEGADKAPKVEF